MLNLFLDYVEKNKLFAPDDKILLAVSGGIDSMVMAHLFAQTDFHWAMAQCNFGLRGEASDGDELFIKEAASNYEVVFYSKRFDTVASAGAGKSIQMAARELRYKWFGELLHEHGFQFIATAHHINDSLETFLLNVARGTGISGLHGILPKQGHIIRPMMFASREMVEKYAKDQKIQWREDSSNASTKYHRNLIRHKVVPVLKEINPSLEQTFVQTLERIRGAENILQHEIAMLKDVVWFAHENSLTIKTDKLMDCHDPVAVLWELLHPLGFHYREMSKILEAGLGISGKRFESASHQLWVERDCFRVEALSIEEAVTPELITETMQKKTVGNYVFTFEQLPVAEAHMSSDPSEAFLDAEALIWPLIVRPWKQGDWFIPLGMQGKKKLSDFMIDKKIPVNLKSKILIVETGGKIAWLAGFRIDDRFKIKPTTKQVLKITMHQS
ncbi:MAG: tRNA lysidine(34) synthetase TilS [Cyclobacteriaceae bacterium]